jgi:hypothetical protein
LNSHAVISPQMAMVATNGYATALALHQYR